MIVMLIALIFTHDYYACLIAMYVNLIIVLLIINYALYCIYAIILCDCYILLCKDCYIAGENKYINRKTALLKKASNPSINK